MLVDTASAPHFKSNYVLGKWIKIYKSKFSYQALKILNEDYFHILWSLCIYRHVLIKCTLQIPHWPLLLSDSPDKYLLEGYFLVFLPDSESLPYHWVFWLGKSAIIDKGYICTLCVGFIVNLLKDGKNQRETFVLKKGIPMQFVVLTVITYRFLFTPDNFESIHRGIRFVIKKMQHKILYRRFSFWVLIYII